MLKRSRSSSYLPFGVKLLISYLLLVIFPVALIGYVSFHTAIVAIKQQTNTTMQGTLLQMKENIAYQTDSMLRVTDQFYLDHTFQQELERKSGYEIYETTSDFLIPKLQNSSNLIPYHSLIRLYITDRQFPEVHGITNVSIDPLGRVDRYEIFQYMRISGKSWWIQPFMQKPKPIDDRLVWGQVEEDARYHNVSLLRKLYNHRELTVIGAIRVTVKLDDLFSSVQYERLGDSSSIIVINADSQLVYTSSSASWHTGSFFKQEDWLERYMVIEQPLELMNWKLIALVPKEDLEQSAVAVKWWTFGACLIIILIVLLVSSLMSHYFSKRVHKLIMSLRQFRGGQFDKRINYYGKDEFSDIAEAFNEMAATIKQLIQEVYVANLAKKEAELEVLQAQISPHFLYNTLSSISRLGKFGQLDKQDQVVKGLAKFYRLTLNQGRLIIPIGKEIEQAQAYLDIQSVKFGGRFTVSYQIDAHIDQYDTIKLILQPFLENIFKHALYRGPLHIRLLARQMQHTIELTIIDDGIGMPCQQLERLQQEQRLGYGIQNVNERIKLHFGKQYGVAIKSIYGAGTAVRIVIPCYREENAGSRSYAASHKE